MFDNFSTPDALKHSNKIVQNNINTLYIINTYLPHIHIHPVHEK